MEFTSTHLGLPDAPPPDWRLAGLSYHSLNFFHNKKFGGRVWKVSLDAGCTCPNRDGTLATSGCIFCDPESFSPSRRRSRRRHSRALRHPRELRSQK